MRIRIRAMNKILGWSALFFLLTGSLSACSSLSPQEPTATALPTATDTPAPTPTITPTVPPTATLPPQPASLMGTVYLSHTEIKPFASSIELRQGENFNLMGKSKTDSNGNYQIENIEPGVYELWVLITTKAAPPAGCLDIAPPDDTWRIGIQFAGNKALTIGEAYLNKALLLAKNLPASDFQVQGFYAVLEDFNVQSGSNNTVNVTLICKATKGYPF